MAIFVLWTLAAAAAGAAGAWELFNRTVTRENEPTTIELPDLTADDAVAAAEPRSMPDVFGLTEAEARQSVVDGGVDPAEVTVVVAPYAGPPGRVVVQDPIAGTADPTEVTLTVSEAATVPDVVGDADADATNTLELLGAAVRRVPQFQDGTTPGTVLAVEPAAGETLPEEVVLRVASEPGQLYLVLVEPEEFDCDEDSGSAVDGRSSLQGFSCLEYLAGVVTMTWSLPAGIHRLTGAVGVADDSEETRDVAVSVSASAGSCGSVTAKPGETVDIACEFTGPSSLTITIPEAPESAEDRVTVVFLDALLHGDPAVLDALIEQ